MDAEEKNSLGVSRRENSKILVMGDNDQFFFCRSSQEIFVFGSLGKANDLMAQRFDEVIKENRNIFVEKEFHARGTLFLTLRMG